MMFFELLLALLPAVGAQDAAAERPVGYADALRLGLQRNPDLVRARAAVAAAEGELISARGAFDPQLSTSVSDEYARYRSRTGYFRGAGWDRALLWDASLSGLLPTGTELSFDWSTAQSQNRSSYQMGGVSTYQDLFQAEATLSVSVAQPLLKGWRLAYNLQTVRAARRAWSSAGAEEMAAQLSVVADVAKAYWDLHYQESLVDIARQSVAVAEEERRIVSAQVETGRMAALDLSRVDAALAQARSGLLDAENDRKAAADSLSVLIGEKPGTPWVAMSTPEDPGPLGLDEERVVAVALEQNPTLESLRLSRQTCAENLANARRSRLPELDALAGAGVDGLENTLAEATSEAFSGSLPTYYVGGQVSFPLGNRVLRGSYLKARAEFDQCDADLKAAEAELDQKVRAQVHVLQSGAEKVALAEANVKFLEEAVSAQKALQRQGRVIQRDLLEAERNLATGQAELAAARVERAVAIVKLGRLEGRIEGVVGE
jgi:outer membrane protein